MNDRVSNDPLVSELDEIADVLEAIATAADKQTRRSVLRDLASRITVTADRLAQR